ncbi:MAG: hypothetical protein SVR94_16975, partial [Pseudomonadota bacterium]|nr:hypothetical protein [Pseudomonadota bacterium]
MTKLYLLIILLFWANGLSAQSIIKGTVTDSLFHPIPHVQVILYDSIGTKIITFTQADSLGEYLIQTNQYGTFNLSFNILSHESMTIGIQLRKENSDSTIVYNPILVPTSFELEEVVVQRERSIRVRGDTISMKADDFRRGDEEVVEDVLKVLPGFEVDDDGIVRFAGKQIKKVMVEGSDLFGKGYSMLTKNLDANAIEDVEILQNYLEDAELKGLEKSDEIAVNLSLKEDKKVSLFGNSVFGISSKMDHEARLVLTSLTKKTKQYLFFNSNSLGKDAIGDLNQFSSSNNALEFSGSLSHLDADIWKNPLKENLPLDPRRLRLNNSGLASYNLFYKPKENFEFKVVSVGVFDKDQV